MMATNNVSCPVWMDWFHGGLQYQIEHHLFPDLPRHQLRAASAYVRPMCAKLGIDYHAPTVVQVGADLFAIYLYKGHVTVSGGFWFQAHLPGVFYPALLPLHFQNSSE